MVVIEECDDAETLLNASVGSATDNTAHRSKFTRSAAVAKDGCSGPSATTAAGSCYDENDTRHRNKRCHHSANGAAATVTAIDSKDGLEQLRHGTSDADAPIIVSSLAHRIEHPLPPTNRLVLEVVQTSALLLVLGSGAAHSAFALISIIIEGQTGVMQVRNFRLPALVATFLQTTSGVASMVTGAFGMTVFVHTLLSMKTVLETQAREGLSRTATMRRHLDAALLGYRRTWQRFHTWCRILVVVINLSPISFVITVIRLFQGASEPPEDNDFIPRSLNPTPVDVYFVVCTGFLVLVSVCATLIGGLTVLSLQLCAILGHQGHSRHVGYHVLRYAYYSLLVALGGAAQLILGIFAWLRFGFGPYEQAIHVATFTVYFPVVSVVVGSVQCVMGYVGWYRSRCIIKKRCIPCYVPPQDDSLTPTDSCCTGNIGADNADCTSRFRLRYQTEPAPYDCTMAYVVSAAFVVTTFLQFLFQPSYGRQEPTGVHATDISRCYSAEGATIASVYLGFFLMPLYLDHLVQTTSWSMECHSTTVVSDRLRCRTRRTS